MSKNYDVVIIGAGVTGLHTAINLKQDLKILLVCKQSLQLSNSSLAQGGIAAAMDLENDSFQNHIEDTLIAGGFKNNKDSLKVLVENGPQEVQKIIDYGVDFDKNPNGEIHMTLEGGHSRARILHHKDSTGKEIVDKLILTAKQLKNVDIIENALVCDVKKHTNFSFDIMIDGEHTCVNSQFALIATGGIGRVYEYTTNSKISTGDGITLAYNLGARIKNLHLVQIHPTAFANQKTRECFLISEAVRGEGAYLLNCNQERFMHKYDDRLELAPRNVVSSAIIKEMQATNSDKFYLDISYKDSQKIKDRFPMIYQNLLKEGFDMTKEKIPVFPCQHYLMGGIDVDLNGETTIENLYAAGECSHTGVHGNNRLASNSLLEALVFAKQVAQSINMRSDKPRPNLSDIDFDNKLKTEILPNGIRTKTREIMQKANFVVPNREEAIKGLAQIEKLKELIENGNFTVDIDYVEIKSLVTIAYLILKEII